MNYNETENYYFIEYGLDYYWFYEPSTKEMYIKMHTAGWYWTKIWSKKRDKLDDIDSIQGILENKIEEIDNVLSL